MPMGYLPFAALAAIDLGGPQAETARLAVEGVRGVLKAGGIGHITHHVWACNSKVYDVQSEKLLSSQVKPSSTSCRPWLLRSAPRMLTGSLQDTAPGVGPRRR